MPVRQALGARGPSSRSVAAKRGSPFSAQEMRRASADFSPWRRRWQRLAWDMVAAAPQVLTRPRAITMRCTSLTPS